MPSAWTIRSGGELQRRRGARRRRKYPDGRARMPALGDMLGPHAQADPRPDLVARDRGAQKIAPAHAGPQLGDRDHRRQRDGADMQHAGAMHVVKFEALHQGAVGQRRVRRGEPPSGAPDRAGRGRIEPAERLHQNPAPRQRVP